MKIRRRKALCDARMLYLVRPYPTQTSIWLVVWGENARRFKEQGCLSAAGRYEGAVNLPATTRQEKRDEH